MSGQETGDHRGTRETLNAKANPIRVVLRKYKGSTTPVIIDDVETFIYGTTGRGLTIRRESGDIVRPRWRFHHRMSKYSIIDGKLGL